MKRFYKLAVICLSILLILVVEVEQVAAAVDLIYFTATAQSDNVFLEWETAQEINNIGFFVQRRSDETMVFERIGDYVPSSDDPFLGGYYSLHDYTAKVGVMYCYRLEILEASGYSEYSEPDCAMILIATPTATTPVDTATVTNSPAPTTTSTPKKTRTITPTFTLTRSPTPRPSATKTPSPTPTGPTVTATLTKTSTPTPTLTLALFAKVNQAFPLPTWTVIPVTYDEDQHMPSQGSVDVRDSSISQRVCVLSIVVIILWLLLASFLIFYLRRLNK